MADHAYDALVLGGGPAGSTAALVLAKAGWRVAFVEKSHFPRRKVCGEFISASSLPLLFELGIGDEFVAAAGPEVQRVGLFERDTKLSAPMPALARGSSAWGRALGRERLDLLLLDAANRAGAELFQPWRAVSAERRDNLWTCTIEGDQGARELKAAIVIAATGSWERGPWTAPGSDIHRDSDLLAFKAHFAGADLAPDLMPMLVFSGGYGGMVTSDGGRISLSCCIRRDRLRSCRNGGRRAAEAVLDHIQASCAGMREALQDARLEGEWLAAGPIRPGIRPRYAKGVFFVGNMAGEAHPIIAEGISMAIQSSVLLGGKLVADPQHGRDLDEIGRAYAKEWRKVFAIRIRSAALFAHLAMRPSTSQPIGKLLAHFPAALTFGAQMAGKIASLPARRALR